MLINFIYTYFLEIIYEIGTEYQEIFHEHNGEKIQLVDSLNSVDDWVETIKKIVLID